MLAAGIAFIHGSLINGELNGFNWQAVTPGAWMSVLYLVFFGSIAGFSAYVWLLKVRSATQVSTHAYVNPVVAVLLGVFFANEHISLIQVLGLVVILGSVLIITLVKYRKVQVAAKREKQEVKEEVFKEPVIKYYPVLPHPVQDAEL